MRWFYLAVICLFAAVVIIFAAQNLQIVTMSFLGLSARVPLALLAAAVYLLGRPQAAVCWRFCGNPSRERGDDAR